MLARRPCSTPTQLALVALVGMQLTACLESDPQSQSGPGAAGGTTPESELEMEGPAPPGVPSSLGDGGRAHDDAAIGSVPVDETWPDLADGAGHWKAARIANPDAVGRPNLDDFGSPVALSADGDTLLVAGPWDDSPGPNPSWDDGFGNSGAIHVFERSGGGWARSHVIKASNAARGSDFGRALAIDATGDLFVAGATTGGDPAPVGTPGHPLDEVAEGVRDHSGAAYVFVREAGGWRELQLLDLTDAPGHADHFGAHLDVSDDGDTVVVSAWRRQHEDRDPELDALGAAYVFVREGDRYVLQQELRAHRAIGGDRFGWTVALSPDGSRIAVGASEPNYAVYELALEHADRRVEIFVRAGDAWTREAIVRPPADTGEAGGFGTALDFGPEGELLAIGEYTYSSAPDLSGGDPGFATGRSHLFRREGASWHSVATLTSPAATASGFYGQAVRFAQAAHVLVVGAGYERQPPYGPPHTSGAVYVYGLGDAKAPSPGLLWSHVREGAQGFGQVLAVSEAGGTVAVASQPTGHVDYDGAYVLEWVPTSPPAPPEVEPPVVAVE